MTKKVQQRVWLFLLFCFGLAVAGVAFYRVRVEAKSAAGENSDQDLIAVRAAQAQDLVAEAGQSGMIQGK